MNTINGITVRLLEALPDNVIGVFGQDERGITYRFFAVQIMSGELKEIGGVSIPWTMIASSEPGELVRRVKQLVKVLP